MRELTKSMMSYTWAMSMFGLQVMLDLLNPQRGPNAVQEAFASMAENTAGQLGGMMGVTFRTADNVQRGLIDLMFRTLMLENLNPVRWVRKGSDAVQKSSSGVGWAALDLGGSGDEDQVPVQGDFPPAGPSNGGSQDGQIQGWGPMP